MGNTRERILAASAELFRRNGYTGTGLKQIVGEASAPFGSIYHFFPGGKEQLAEEVIRTSGMEYAKLFDLLIAPAPDLITGLEQAFAAAAVTLRETGYADACPIATVALEVASTNETLRRATADVFTAWIDTGTGVFTRFGLSADDARRLTVAVITGLEGAFVLSRSLRNVEPLAIAGEAAVAMAREMLTRPGRG
ncbi:MULTISPECIES: TetR/AcrR family transcriptional regulator [Amycolatopsis]|uniref:TetR/AcrR family transcriptional regulator n=1 Tax=Amycolatopsis thermalba TaxID=944492 RepID=A0ABY4NT68_9PSEU|nr:MULTISPECIES: TetR/AcrR family transcriptional regulator [Amycolatopsis]OXM65757.1 TetR family transcriptional regulator [Amycolatopsis sp. KNN50.9b]UQS23242.1 TetR/AcrR family transcriptional regulator [Amycolatopsis thermalba]